MTTQRSAGISVPQGLRAPLRFCQLAVLAAAALSCTPENATTSSNNPSNPPGGDGSMTPVPGMNMPGTTPMPNTGGSASGMAQVKFCNGIGSDKGSVEVDIAVGTLRFKLASGACTPAKGQACQAVPAGRTRISFSTGGKEVFAQDVALDAGQEYLVVSTVDRVSQKVGLAGGKLSATGQCASADPFAGASGGFAAAKFCHNLGVDDGAGGKTPVTFDLTIGNVRLPASSADCSSPSGQMCLALPSGPTTATLTHNGEVLTSSPVTIEAGRDYLFGLKLLGTSPVITGKALDAPQTCSASAPADAASLPTLGATPPPTTPPPTGGATAIKLCNRLPGAGGGNIAEMTIGDNIMLTAKPGQCSPAKGMPCIQVPAGAAPLVLLIDGNEVLNDLTTFPAGREFIIRLADDALHVEPVPAGMMCTSFEPL
jgi:hypothetical protein